MNINNPLKQYFRQPAIYIKLPSQGKYYSPDALNPSITGEYPVYPMTAIDEITYRTPDAMFNGQATVNVIQSCVPDIKNAWQTPAMDMDTGMDMGMGMDMDMGMVTPQPPSSPRPPAPAPATSCWSSC